MKSNKEDIKFVINNLIDKEKTKMVFEEMLVKMLSAYNECDVKQDNINQKDITDLINKILELDIKTIDNVSIEHMVIRLLLELTYKNAEIIVELI
jgi:hypothetical protein